MQYLFFQRNYPRITDRVGLERMLTEYNPIDNTHSVPWDALYLLNMIVNEPIEVQAVFQWGRQNPANGHTTKRFMIVEARTREVIEELTVWARIAP